MIIKKRLLLTGSMERKKMEGIPSFLYNWKVDYFLLYKKYYATNFYYIKSNKVVTFVLLFFVLKNVRYCSCKNWEKDV